MASQGRNSAIPLARIAMGLSALAPTISNRPWSANSRQSPARSPPTRAACNSRIMRSATTRSATVSLLRSGQRRPNFTADLFERGPGIRNHGPQAVEKMNHTWVASVGHFHMRTDEAFDIVAALVAQRIEFRRVNESAGEAVHIVGAQRRDPRVGRIRSRRRIVQKVMIERGLIDQVAAGEVPLGIRRAAVVE